MLLGLLMLPQPTQFRRVVLLYPRPLSKDPLRAQNNYPGAMHRDNNEPTLKNFPETQSML